MTRPGGNGGESNLLRPGRNPCRKSKRNADEKRIAVCGLPQYDIERMATVQFAEEERIREAEFPPSEQEEEGSGPDDIYSNYFKQP